jgi:Protein of unknown function (DUF3995)
MSLFIAAIMFIPLLAIAIAHFLWSIGRSWPIRDPAMLAATVMGFPGRTRMPKLASLGVAVLVLLAGVIGLALADPVSGGIPLDVLGLLIGLIFLARGIVGYTSWWQARTPVEPFRTLDRRNYSPLCLILGAGFLALVVLRFI